MGIIISCFEAFNTLLCFVAVASVVTVAVFTDGFAILRRRRYCLIFLVIIAIVIIIAIVDICIATFNEGLIHCYCCYCYYH